MGRNQSPAAADQKSQALQDQQFKERLRIAEHLVQVLREAGYSCKLADDGRARMLERLQH